jgi:hypothetical protein
MPTLSMAMVFPYSVRQTLQQLYIYAKFADIVLIKTCFANHVTWSNQKMQQKTSQERQ